MIKSLLRCFSCLAFLAVIGVPAQGEGLRYVQMPEELFAPKTNPHRVASVDNGTIERVGAAPTRIMSHGRQVRLIGVPFMPDLEQSIDFVAATEATWWTTMMGFQAAPVADTYAPAVASIDPSPRSADLAIAVNLTTE